MKVRKPYTLTAAALALMALSTPAYTAAMESSKQQRGPSQKFQHVQNLAEDTVRQCDW